VATCERCGGTDGVEVITYFADGKSRSGLMCANCKSQTFVRARVRVTSSQPRGPSRRVAVFGWLLLAAGAVVCTLTVLGAMTR
jgi:hypothetical protein